MEISELQEYLLQLCDELRKEQEEKCQALARIEMLEQEAENVRESESKMLDSLVHKTKQFEQTKISLEEAKLEIVHLNDTLRIMNDPKQIQRFRIELKNALEAEERSKKAMDDLAVALKEVTAEANKANKSYFQAQSELEKLLAETDRLKSEAEGWKVKEKGFVDCVKILEREITHTKKDNERLTDTKKAAREEISNLRDIVKQAIRESNIVKEALEISREENSELKKLLLERDNAINNMKQNYESLKVTEAAAVDSVKELSGLLAATSSMESNKSSDTVNNRAPVDNRMLKPMVKFPSDNWTTRWNSIGDSKLLEGSIFDMLGSPCAMEEEEEDERFELDSRMNLKKLALDLPKLGSPMKLKTKQGLRKIGNILRMRSFNKY